MPLSRKLYAKGYRKNLGGAESLGSLKGKKKEITTWRKQVIDKKAIQVIPLNSGKMKKYDKLILEHANATRFKTANELAGFLAQRGLTFRITIWRIEELTRRKLIRKLP